MRVVNLKGEKVKDANLPEQFKEEYRPDLIKRAVLAIQSNKRQAYGAKSDAGMRQSAKLSRRRRKYRGGYGRGISRVPRKVMTRRGTQFVFTAAVAPGTVGGRKAHPPKAVKDFSKKINIKERRKAIRSALGATLNKELVKSRGHLFKETPIIVDKSIEKIKKAKELKEFLIKVGLEKELERRSEKKIRAGKGKSRGRKYRIKKGPLIVVSDKCDLIDTGKNLQGIDITKIKNINAELLAPGCNAGRLTIYSENALEKMNKEKLFMEKKK